MRRWIPLFLMMLPAAIAQPRYAEDDFRLEDRSTVDRTFHVAAGENASKLFVDQVHGFIHVTGGSGADIKVTVEKRIRAETQRARDDARKETTLDMKQDGNTVKLYEDGPFRSRDGWRGDRWYGYYVMYDTEIQVPAGASVDLNTVSGSIQVKNTAGEFRVHTVSGKVELEGMSGSGSAQTVNGSVKTTFSRNPAKESSFHTVNGSIDLYFHDAPDADLSFETVHGGVFADFEVTTLPATVSGKITGTRFVYRSNGHMKVRAGKGGPELSFRTVNGSVHLHSKAI